MRKKSLFGDDTLTLNSPHQGRTGLGLEDEETLEGRSGHSRGSKRDLEEENGDTERDFRTRQQAHYVARRMAGDVLRARAAAERLDRSKVGGLKIEWALGFRKGNLTHNLILEPGKYILALVA